MNIVLFDSMKNFRTVSGLCVSEVVDLEMHSVIQVYQYVYFQKWSA